MDAVKYFEEKARMTENCEIDCEKCLLSYRNRGTILGCRCFEYEYPEKVIEIVERWSKAHPQKTQADLFFERYPDAKKDKNGFPALCPSKVFTQVKVLGCECVSIECEDCRKKYWSAPVDG